MRNTTELTAGWRLDLIDAAPGASDGLSDIPATVPGCVHTDLMAAGLLDDPYLDRNESTQHWIGDSDWRYATTLPDLDTRDADRVDLVFDGLDTVSEVTLGGVTLGRTANMHRGYRFDVTPRLDRDGGGQELAVVFSAARRYAESIRDELGARPGAYPEPLQYIRKMACNFGWDWGPTLVTAGIWKQVRLERWSTGRLSSVRPQVRVLGDDGVVEVAFDVERAGTAAALRVRARIAGASAYVDLPAGVDAGNLRLELADVDLWWPHDLGDQPLYGLTLDLEGPDGDRLDTWSRRVGFRTVEIDTTPDEHGTPFAFRVNGRDLFVRGVNWIPDDCFPTRISRERLEQRFGQAVDAHVNLLRVWGGGMYESDDFYDACDERGMLVWQDFPFACAAYPEEEPLRSEVEAEARDNVTRLMPHPSLVLWNGNNENIWGYHDWGWHEELGGRTWGWGYYADLLPRIVAELDPGRAYWPGSPYSGTPDLHPNDPAHGNTHIWTVWNEADYTDYRDWRPRFLSEFGFQGPPAWATLTRAVHDDPLLPDSPGVLAHQKAEDGNGKLSRGMAPHLPAPRDTDEWHYLTQLNQARAIEYGVEHFRSLGKLCRGTILWQLNDCWPVTSWAAIDGDGRLKPLWYALRRAYRPQLLTLQPRDGEVCAVAVNDGLEDWSGTLEVTRRDLRGAVLAKTTRVLSVAPGSSATVAVDDEVIRASVATDEVVVAEIGAHRALWQFVEDRELALDVDAAEVAIAAVPGGVEFTVTARSLVRGLVVQADRLDPEAEVEDQELTLLAGDRRTVHIATSAPADDPRWTTTPVLWSLNTLR